MNPVLTLLAPISILTDDILNFLLRFQKNKVSQFNSLLGQFQWNSRKEGFCGKIKVCLDKSLK